MNRIPELRPFWVDLVGVPSHVVVAYRLIFNLQSSSELEAVHEAY